MEWIKYSFVCNGECDALLEFTFKDGFDWPSGVVQITCPCGSSTTLLSAEYATINNNNEKKEEAPMNATTEYLQSQIDELKSQLSKHSNCDYWKNENGRVQGQVIELIRSAYAEETDTSEILIDLARIVDFNPTKEIEFTATISFTGRVDVPMEELEDFDLTALLEDAYVDINNGDVVIDNYELYDANEC